MRIKDLDQLRCFLFIYQNKSLTKTALKMGISKAAVAKRLAILESELGYVLFKRSTRLINPTSEAHALAPKAQAILDQVHDLENTLNEDSSMKGQIRLTCSLSMAQRFIGVELSLFQKKYPDIQIELVVTDSVLDLVEQNIDLAIRINPSTNSNMVGRKLGDHQLLLVASEKYLAEYGNISKVSDLHRHDLLFINTSENLKFSKSKIKLKEFLSRRRFLTNDPTVLTRLSLAGMGIAARSQWDVKDSIKKGELKVVLKSDPFESQGEIWLLSSTGRMQSQRVRTLFEYLAQRLPSYI